MTIHRTAYLLTTDVKSERTLFSESVLHLFSFKTPINWRFYQRKVTLPCAY
jgi:hypothetical protein